MLLLLSPCAVEERQIGHAAAAAGRQRPLGARAHEPELHGLHGVEAHALGGLYKGSYLRHLVEARLSWTSCVEERQLGQHRRLLLLSWHGTPDVLVGVPAGGHPPERAPVVERHLLRRVGLLVHREVDRLR
eukprot:7788745-Pyramimonas_sp.AAC.2